MDSYDIETKYRIEHAGRISFSTTRTVVLFFCALAVFAAAIRIGIRLTIRRRLFLDDYILLFATAALGATTGLLYRFTWLIFLINVLKRDPTVTPTTSDLRALMHTPAVYYSMSALMWSTIFPVKLCFLVSFKPLIKSVSRGIVIWYWSTFALTIAAWGFLIALPFIERPPSGRVMSLQEHIVIVEPWTRRTQVSIAGNWLVFWIDALTDMMIVAIPVWILRHIRIDLAQKIGIGSFLCLSLVMVVVATTRLCLSLKRPNGAYLMWDLLFYIEGCIAVTMASIAAYRAVFVERRKNRENEMENAMRQQHIVHIGGRPFHLQEVPADNFRDRIEQIRHMHNGSDILGEFADDASVPDRRHTGGASSHTVLSFIRIVNHGKNEERRTHP